VPACYNRYQQHILHLLMCKHADVCVPHHFVLCCAQVVKCLLLPVHGSKAQTLAQADITHDLDAAAASNNRGQLLETWARWQQLQAAAGSTSSSAASSSLAVPATPAELHAMVASCSQQQQEAWQALLMFVQQTSFADAAYRQQFIAERVLPVLRQLTAPAAHLAAALEQQGSTAALDTHEAQLLLTQLQSSLAGLTAVQDMLPWLQELCSDTLCSNILQANDMMERNHNRALVWQLQSLLLQPIWHFHEDISMTISAIVQQSLRDGQHEQAQVFKQLSVLLQFAACRWCSGLMLPESLLQAAAAGASQGAGITAELVDRLASLSCYATLANQLAAAVDVAEKALAQAGQSASHRKSTSSTGSSIRQAAGKLSKKQKKALRKQRKRERKQELVVTHSDVNTASIQEAAAAVDELVDGEDAQLLLSYLSHTQCQAHSSLAEALLADCQAAAATACPAVSMHPLAPHAAQTGQFGRYLQQAAAVSLSPQPAGVWAGVLLGMPVGAAASITKFEVLPLEGLHSSLSCLHANASSSITRQAATAAAQFQVLLLLAEGGSVDASACSAALVLQQQLGQPTVVHVVADSSSMPDALASLQAGYEEQHSRQQFIAAQHQLSAPMPAEDEDEPAEAQSELLCCKIKQLVLSGADCTDSRAAAAHEVSAAPPAVQAMLAAALQQCSNQEQVQMLRQAQQLLQQLQELQDGLAEVLDSADVSAAAAAAKQKLVSSFASVYSLKRQAQDVEQHVGQLYARHLTVTSLAVGERMLMQLQQLSQQAPHTLEIQRIKSAVKQQMGCADTYLQYMKLVHKLRSVCKITSQSAQQQLGTSLLTGRQDTADKLYAAAPAATAFLLQVYGDVLGSFEASSSSIRLVRQHCMEQLQQHDKQLLATLHQLSIPQSTIDRHGLAGLLVSFERLLTAPVEPVAAAAEAAAGQHLRPRAVLLDNAAARLQQKQEMLAGLAEQLDRLLDEARGVKPSPGALVSHSM
jgi:hypothetical protein